MYAAFPSHTLQESDKLKIIAHPDTVRMMWEHDINVYGLDMMIPPPSIPLVINHITTQAGCRIGDVLGAFPALDRAALWRTLGWLIKLGIVGLV
jgi:hypothetical protein